MDIRQRFIKKLIIKKDEQFSNLIQYCLHGKNESLNNIEQFLGIINEFSQALGFETLLDMSSELNVCLALYGKSMEKDRDSLLKILELYSDIYSEVEKIDKKLFNTTTAEEKDSNDDEHNSAVHHGSILLVDDEANT